MSLRLRRRGGAAEMAADEGPFVSFTDLFIGILFLFLILVAALMLMHQEAVQRLTQQNRDLQAQLDALNKKEAENPPFRLGIIFNIYQRTSPNQEWIYSRTVRVFRAPNNRCVNTVILRSNLSTAWKPPVDDTDIPTAAQGNVLKAIPECGLSASGDYWDSGSEEGSMRRTAPNLYEGSATLYKATGASKVYIQYRVLGIYDDYFR